MLGLWDTRSDCPWGAPSLCGCAHYAWPEGGRMVHIPLCPRAPLCVFTLFLQGRELSCRLPGPNVLAPVPEGRAVGQYGAPLWGGRLMGCLPQADVLKVLLILQDLGWQPIALFYLHFHNVTLQVPLHSLIQEGQILHDGNHHHVPLFWSLRWWRCGGCDIQRRLVHIGFDAAVHFLPAGWVSFRTRWLLQDGPEMTQARLDTGRMSHVCSILKSGERRL